MPSPYAGICMASCPHLAKETRSSSAFNQLIFYNTMDWHF
jgi:hypothetical protein